MRNVDSEHALWEEKHGFQPPLLSIIPGMTTSASPVPRPEYPRPQFVRQEWLCLNGEWEFEIDQGDSGLERGLLERPLKQTIAVPFCPESKFSGIENTDYLIAVWYRRRVTVPAGWAGRGLLLHFQAVDYDATVWVDGAEVRRHRGGFTPFTCELGKFEAGREIEIVLRARDSKRDSQPRGKQVLEYKNWGCMYTRTTGIWQSVWIEPVPDTALLRPRLTPEAGRGLIRLEQGLSRSARGLQLRVTLRDESGEIVSRTVPAGREFTTTVELEIPQERRRYWSPQDPHLYDVEIELLDAGGAVVDRALSYAGLRSVTIQGQAILLNGEPVFQRLVLDQGYYEDGILTAPTDEALKADIELSLAAGFNGARLHAKVFEERFYYWADKLGYLVWGEFADWGCNLFGNKTDRNLPGPTYITQWLEVLNRDYSHPSIIGWCPLNETGQVIDDTIHVFDDTIWGMFLATKTADRTRPVIDSSGWAHRIAQTDVMDCHDYTQSVADFAARHAGLAEGNPVLNNKEGKEVSSKVPYRGQPYFVSEFGGILWDPKPREGEGAWGYGQGPQSPEEFYERFEGLCGVLLGNPHMFGYCYTQLTDVFQEKNGIYFFDRTPKFDMERIRAAQVRRAAIESQSA